MKRAELISSISMGTLGAIIAGLLWWRQAVDEYFAQPVTFAAIPVGIITGFASCLLMSLLYFRVIRRKKLIARFVFGLLFGSMAGAICGFFTGLFTGILTTALGFLSPSTGMLGLMNGFLIGLLMSFMMTLVYWFVVVKKGRMDI